MTPQANAVVSVGDLVARSNLRDDGREASVALNGRLMFGGLLVCLGYYLGARLGFALTFLPHPVSVMWPPNSILLAALLLTPIRSWWFILVCALPAHFAIQLQSNVPPTMMICWFISNSTEALLGAGLTRLIVGGPFRLVGLANTSAFLLCGVFLGPFLSSFLDSAFVRWNEWGQGAYWEIWRIRFFSNALTSLTVAPLIPVWAKADYGRLRRANWKLCLEAALLAVGLVVVGFKVFVWHEPGPNADLALLYAPLPFLLWAAIRFGARGATTAAFVTALISIWGAAHARGPFSTHSPEANALSLQMFLIVVSILLLLLSAVMDDREKAQERFAKAFRSSPDAIIISRQKDGHIIEWNERAEALFGFRRHEALSRTAFDLNIYFCEARLVKAVADTTRGTPFHNLELPFRTKSGELRQALISAETEEIEGELCLIVVTRDITEWRRAEGEAREVSSKLITAQEDERKRIARELHDDLNQRLALLSIEMDLLAQDAGTDRERALRHIEVMAGRVREMSSEVHRLSYQLHPVKLDQLGLLVAARTFCREVSLQAGIAVHFEQHDVPRDVGADVALCLYRVIQEAVQNSVRHNGGAAVRVSLIRAGEQIRLLITDEGKGFDVEHAIHKGGLGLVSMRERVRQVHGSIQFTSSPGKGTRIEVNVPLRLHPAQAL
jgi:PAS domain S-box-containing protein